MAMSLTRIKQEDVTEGLKAIGGNVVLSGRYHDQVKGAAANLILSGTFDRNVEVGGAKITLAPKAGIKGDLIYSAAVLDRQESSEITGKVAQRKMVVKEGGWLFRLFFLLISVRAMWVFIWKSLAVKS